MPTAGRSRGKLMGSLGCLLALEVRAGTLVALSVGACGAWAPRAALDFFA